MRRSLHTAAMLLAMLLVPVVANDSSVIKTNYHSTLVPMLYLHQPLVLASNVSDDTLHSFLPMLSFGRLQIVLDQSARQDRREQSPIGLSGVVLSSILAFIGVVAIARRRTDLQYRKQAYRDSDSIKRVKWRVARRLLAGYTSLNRGKVRS